jgi:hypothetical protein
VIELEYKTMIFPPNYFYDLEEFSLKIQSRELYWREGLQNVLQNCEEHELYEYCQLIKIELEKDNIHNRSAHQKRISSARS